MNGGNLVFVLVLLALSPFWMSGECARILAVFPTPAKSHQIVFRNIVNRLLERGHLVTLLSPERIQTENGNLTQIDWSSSYTIVDREWNVAAARESNMGYLKIAESLFKTGQMIMESQMNHPEVIRLIDSDQQFDLVLAEYVGVPPILAFGERFRAPVIGIASFDAAAIGHAAVGNVFNPVVQPEIMLPFGSRLTFPQRCMSILMHLYLTFVRYPIEYAKFDQLTRRVFGQNVSNSFDLMNSIDLLMTYGNPALGYIRPTVPATVTLHSIHLRPPRPLPQELQQYLDRSSNGCIYVSFGSLVKSTMLSQRTMNVFLNAFRNLNYTVLWKWESDRMENKSANIKTMKWVPQQDVLAHPNIKLFITQGGLHSIEEAIDRHVPLIVIPFVLDQYRNSLAVQEKQIGESLDLSSMTSDRLEHTIRQVISNKSYKDNIVRLDGITKDEPQPSLEKAVWWIEYVIRHRGAKEIRYHGIRVPFYQYHFWDVIVLVFAAFLLFLIALFRIAKGLQRKHRCLYWAEEKDKIV